MTDSIEQIIRRFFKTKNDSLIDLLSSEERRKVYQSTKRCVMRSPFARVQAECIAGEST